MFSSLSKACFVLHLFSAVDEVLLIFLTSDAESCNLVCSCCTAPIHSLLWIELFVMRPVWTVGGPRMCECLDVMMSVCGHGAAGV